MKQFHVLNLGAGVQSTTLALMSHRGIIPKFDVAIFADTQEEPEAVNEHLKWLVEEVKPSFPIWIRTRGKLGDHLIYGVKELPADSQRRIKLGMTHDFPSIPAFTKGESGNLGLKRRDCTADYKVQVVDQAIRRELFGLEPRQRAPKDVQVFQYFGLSYDEPGRVIRVRARLQGVAWSEPKFPLFEMEMTRRGCLNWLEKYGIPHQVPRSACVFCPYHSNAEWKRIKETDPMGWARSVEIDEALRSPGSVCTQGLRDQMYLHRECRPLTEIDFNGGDTKKGQELFGFAQECEGMCGL